MFISVIDQNTFGLSKVKAFGYPIYHIYRQHFGRGHEVLEFEGL